MELKQKKNKEKVKALLAAYLGEFVTDLTCKY